LQNWVPDRIIQTVLTYCAMIIVCNNGAHGRLTILLWLQAENRAAHVTSFTQTLEYKRKVGFHLITGGSGSGM